MKSGSPAHRAHNFQVILYLLIALCCWLATATHAQVFPQGQTGGRGTGSGQRTYPNNTQVGEATISVDPETRKIIVVTDEDTNLQIKDVITSLDHPRPQVLIKVVFLEVTYNNASDIGIEGGYNKGIDNSTTANGANVFGLSGLGSVATNVPLNALGQPIQSFQPLPPGAGLYQILGQDYQVTLRAIAQAGKAEILSRPSILARNSQPATISLGQEVPLVTNTRFDAVNGQISTFNYRQVGIILRVTPFITSDGMVEMIVSPETSQLADRSQWVPTGGTALSPVINSRSADTVVVVPDGQTVIIGGLMNTQKTVSDSKIPILGDIPVLGAAFRHRTKTDVKTELMIFLTPRIVQAPAQLAGLATEERQRSTMKPKAISEEELDRFFDTLPVKDPNAPQDAAPAKNGSKSKKNHN
ncbi:MAG TPA: hypothetical protein VFA77_00415 [Candidatus Eisenbacteria bacterium]|nr:hypothetical protein [Candidatus Eisenbacteria bacterium]